MTEEFKNELNAIIHANIEPLCEEIAGLREFIRNEVHGLRHIQATPSPVWPFASGMWANIPGYPFEDKK